MQLRTLGTSELKISPIIMGTWQAGKDMWVGIDDEQSARAMRAAYEAGVTAFDTAAVYGNGHSERILGKALAEVRSQIIFATKVFANRLKFDQVIDSCHRSLKNLNTDYIDLFQVHWPAGSFGTKAVPIEETMAAMNKLQEKGKIRAIGVSNFSRAQLEEATRYARIDSLQFPYSLFWRHIEKDAMAYCRKNDITILSYSPLAQGLLTGKFGAGHEFEKGDHRRKNRLFKSDNLQKAQEALDRLRPIAAEYKVSLAQLALAWVISHASACAIAGARNADQAVENARAADLVLSENNLVRMDEIGRLVTDNLDENPVMWDF